nr:MAG TPA: hypothetical protein [Caudoviricetes sp.]
MPHHTRGRTGPHKFRAGPSWSDQPRSSNHECAEIQIPHQRISRQQFRRHTHYNIVPSPDSSCT